MSETEIVADTSSQSELFKHDLFHTREFAEYTVNARYTDEEAEKMRALPWDDRGELVSDLEYARRALVGLFDLLKEIAGESGKLDMEIQVVCDGSPYWYEVKVYAKDGESDDGE